MSTMEGSVTEQTWEARSREALNLVKYHVIGAMAIGMLPLPLIDIAALTVLQLRMIARLSKLYNILFSQNIGKSVITSLLGSIIPGTAQRWSWSLLKFTPLLARGRLGCHCLNDNGRGRNLRRGESLYPAL